MGASADGEAVLMSLSGRLLVWLSGADYETLAAQHGRVRAKYVGTGAGIAITGLIAGLSMWFALTTALGTPAVVAALLAACWVLVIMSIDRWLVVSLDRREGRGAFRYLLSASPRLALAIVLGFVISTPITLRVFQKEIDFRLEQAQATARAAYLVSPARVNLMNQIKADQDRVESLAAGGTGIDKKPDLALTSLQNQLASLKKQLASDTTQETGFYNEWQCEAYGVPLPDGSSCPVGSGPLAAAAKSSYFNYKAAVTQDQASIRSVQASITDAQTSIKKAAIQQLPTATAKAKADQARLTQQDNAFAARNAGNTGLLARINALDAAAAANPGLQAGRWLLFLVFFMIDCLPALMAITHALNDPDDYEKAIMASAGTREEIAKKNLRDLELDADRLSRERARNRGVTAKAIADMEQRVKLHKSQRWADKQTRRRVRPVSKRAATRSARSRQRIGTPPARSTPQVFIRRYVPQTGRSSRNGHVPGDGPSGGGS
jgi:Domain of unknown function (DUF4407)